MLQKPIDDVFNDSGHIDASFSVQNDELIPVQTVGTSTVQGHETSTAQSSENSKFQLVATTTIQTHATSKKCENVSNKILQMATNQNDKVSGIATNKSTDMSEKTDTDIVQENSTTKWPNAENAKPVQSSSKQFKDTTLPISENSENLNKSDKSSNLSDRVTFQNQVESENLKLLTCNEESGDFDAIQATSSLDTPASTDMDAILHNFYDGERTCSDEEFEAEAIELLVESQQMEFSAEDFPNSVWSYSDPEFQDLLASLSSDQLSDEVLCHPANPHSDQLANPASDQDPKPVDPNNLRPSPEQSVSESHSFLSDPLSDEVLCHPANPHSDQLVNPASDQDPKPVDPNNLLRPSPEQSVSESHCLSPEPLSGGVLCHPANPHPFQLVNSALDQDPKPVYLNNLLQQSPEHSVSESHSLLSDPLSGQVLCHPPNPHSDKLANPASDQDPRPVDMNNLLQPLPDQYMSESVHVDSSDLNLCPAPVPAKKDSNTEAVAKPVANQPTVQDLMGSVEVCDKGSDAGIQHFNIVAKPHLIPPTVPVFAEQHISMAYNPLSNPPSKSLSADGLKEVLKQVETVSNPVSAITDKPDAITEKPDAITDKLDAITDKPDAITEKPDAITDKPDAIADKPDAITDKPVAITEKPDVTSPTTTRPLKPFVIPRILKDRTSILPSQSSRLLSNQQGTVNILTRNARNLDILVSGI